MLRTMAEIIADHQPTYDKSDVGCTCEEFTKPRATVECHSEHVADELTKAGYGKHPLRKETMKEIEEMKAREKAATEGPWEPEPTQADGYMPHYGVKSLAKGWNVVYAHSDWEGYGNGSSRQDAEFIAHARTDIPQLLAALDAITALHVPVMEDGEPVGCSMCDWEHPSYAYGKAWPCPTLAAITTALEGTA